MSALLVSTWIHTSRGLRYSFRRCTSPPGVVPVGSGDGVGDCHDVANLQKERLLFPFVSFWVEKLDSFSKSLVSHFCLLLGIAHPCYRDAYSVGTLSGLFGRKAG